MLILCSGFGPGTRARDLAYEFERYVNKRRYIDDQLSCLDLPSLVLPSHRDFAVRPNRHLTTCATTSPPLLLRSSGRTRFVFTIPCPNLSTAAD